MRLSYLEQSLFIKKLLKQKKFLKILLIIQRQTLLYNKHLPIFVLYTILKNKFSKIRIFIINNINFNNKT